MKVKKLPDWNLSFCKLMIAIWKEWCYTVVCVSALYAGMRVVYAVRQAEKGMQ